MEGEYLGPHHPTLQHVESKADAEIGGAMRPNIEELIFGRFLEGVFLGGGGGDPLLLERVRSADQSPKLNLIKGANILFVVNADVGYLYVYLSVIDDLEYPLSLDYSLLFLVVSPVQLHHLLRTSLPHLHLPFTPKLQAVVVRLHRDARLLQVAGHSIRLEDGEVICENQKELRLLSAGLEGDVDENLVGLARVEHHGGL